MKIREFVNNDLHSVHQLIEQLTGHSVDAAVVAERFIFLTNHPNEFLYVADDAGEVVGLMSFRIRENVEDDTFYGEVSLLVVDENQRRKGIATKLIDFAETLAKDKGCIGLWLVSGFGREEKAHTFYKNIGFEITGYRFVKRF